MLFSHWLTDLANCVFTKRGGRQRRSLTRGTSLLRSHSRDASVGVIAAEIMAIEPLEDRTLLSVTQLGSSQTVVENSGAAFSATFNYSVPAGTQRLLVVSTAGGGNSADATSVTFAGTPLTQGPEHANGAFTRAEIFYLPLGDSATATSGTIVVNYSRNFLFFATATAFQGVNQASPIGPSSGGSGSTLSVNSTTGDMVIDAIVGKPGSVPMTPGVAQVSQSITSGLNFNSQVGGVSTTVGTSPASVVWAAVSSTISHVAVNINQTVSTVVNQPPSGADKTVTLDEDTPYVFSSADFGFSDSGNTPPNSFLAVAIKSKPLNGTLTINGTLVNLGQLIPVANIGGGLFVFTPTADTNGDKLASFTFQVQDNGGTSGGGVDFDQTPNRITFNVNAIADTRPDVLNSVEDSSVTANVLTGTKGATADTFSDTSKILVEVTDGSRGHVSFSPNGDITYIPSGDFHGEDQFTYTVNAGGTLETGKVTVILSPVPDITDDALVTDEDSPITANLITGTKGASADSFENSSRALTSVTQGAKGEVTFAANGNVTYTPNRDYNGSDSFTYTVTSNGTTETATVNVTINPVADITPESVSTDEDVVVTFNAITGALGGTADTFENPGRHVTAVTQGSHGTVSFLTGGRLTYTPDPDFYGQDEFTYTVTSGSRTETAAVLVLVNAVSDITADTLTTTAGTPITANLLTGTNGAVPDSFESASAAITSVTQPTKGSVTFQPGGSVTYTPGALFAGSDSFTYTVTSGGRTETANVTIVGTAPPPQAYFIVEDASVVETIGLVQVIVKLSAASSQTVTVDVNTGGTATAGSDFSINTNQLVFAPGETSKAIQVSVVDTIGYEATETVVLTLGNPTNATLGPVTNTTIVIWDIDSAPVVTFNSPGGTVNENSGTALATVNLSAPSGADTIIPFSVGGTATELEDFLIAASPLVIPAGQTSGTIQIDFIDVIGYEPTENIVLTLETPTNGTLGTAIVKTITINDLDAPPTVSFTAGSASVLETAGYILVPVQLSFVSVVPTTIPFLVTGTASNGDDYSIDTDKILIPAGQDTGYIPISIVDLIGFEPSETIVLTLQSPTNANLGNLLSTTVTILDIDAPPQVSFDNDLLEALETFGVVEVTVNLSFASVLDTTIPFSISGTASMGADYAISASPLVIPAGQTSGKIAISIIDGVSFETPESVVLTLGVPTNATVGAIPASTLLIYDIDARPTVSFDKDVVTVSEADGTYLATVNLAYPSSEVVTILVSSGGTASQPSDYTLSGNPLIILPGATSGTIQLNLVNSAGFESPETVVLTLNSPSNGTLGEVSTQTVTIVDSSAAPEVTLSTATQFVSEAVVLIEVTVNLSFAIGQNVTVPFSLSGSAAAPADYVIAANQVVIPAGHLSATFNISVVNDATIENNETVVVTLGTPTIGTLGGTIEQTITILDNDTLPVAAFNLANQAVSEDAGSVTLTVQLSLVPQSDVTIPFSVSGGSASSSDFSLSASPLVIPAGSTSGSITLTLNNDVLIENSESVIVTLGNPTNATLGGIQSQQVNINDNDTNHAPTISTGQSFQVAENPASQISVGTVIASDSDLPAPFNTLTFTLSSNPGNKFVIDPQTGLIRVAQGALLDFETTPTVTLGVTVSDGAPTPLSSTANVTINLVNVNEAPVVTPATLFIGENPALNAPVGTVLASDPDVGQPKTFTITNGNTGGVFAINPTTGAIAIATPSAINFELNAMFLLTVQVTDNGNPALSSSADITINVIDANEPPVVTVTTFTMAENPAVNARVGTVIATDPDAGQTRTFAITNGNTNGAFAIEPTTGAITVATPSAINFETTPTFTLSIQATDNGNPALSSAAAITINITNVNEAPVVTPVAFTMAENPALNAAVGTVLASDPDAGQTRAFSITAGNVGGAFAIDSATGSIRVASPGAVNFETTSGIFTLTVRVTDNASPSAFGTATVTINVTNVNDAPDISAQSFDIAENAAVSAIVGNVVATDEDSGQVKTYSITQGNTGGVFSIDPSTGRIIVAVASLDFETTPTYQLTVRVADNGNPALSDTATVTVRVTNANDAPILVDNSADPVFVFKAQTPTRPFESIKVSDPDGATTLASVKVTLGIPPGRKNLDVVSLNPAGVGVVTTVEGTGQRQFTITLNNGVTAAQVETFLKNITFFSKGSGLKATTRQFTATVTDKDGATSNTITRRVLVRKK